MKHELPARSTLRLELVLCGKPKCHKWHGPYWYAYWEEPGGKTRKAYVGKKLPPEIVRRRMKESERSKRAGRLGSTHDDRVLRELQLDWTAGD